MFKLIKQHTRSKARLGALKTRKGEIKTPCFMPIATKGALKTLSFEDIEKLNPALILGNTYHLMLRPGAAEMKKLGGLHKFMNWPKPLLTDSGGFQVFSLAKMRKISENGVCFSSHLDGTKFFMSPEDSIKIQIAIGSDIMMVLDECVALPAKKDYLERSVELTAQWAKQCKDYFMSCNFAQDEKPLLFGIVQGGLNEDLRKKSARKLMEIGFDGYAVGGLSVGETEQEMCTVLDYICDELPEDKPRYLMGVGYPQQIVKAVKRGIDMFDCVIPTREARHGRLYFFKPKADVFSTDFCKVINIKNEKFKFDLAPINKDSKFKVLQKYSKAYLRHLFATDEPLAQRLATLNNLEFYLDLMEKIRADI